MADPRDGIKNWLRGLFSIDPEWDPDADLKDHGPDHGDAAEAFAESDAVELAVNDTIDLHTFAPRDVKKVVEAWLDEVEARGLTEVRIIHGRGVGVQRQIVRKLLERDARVVEFGDAPAEAGGWGATLAKLQTMDRGSRGGNEPGT